MKIKFSLSLLLLCSFCIVFYSHAQVGINATGAAPANSAMLDVSSTTKGVLIPRMTTAQRNTLTATATQGLLVFDTTTNGFWFYNGSSWQNLTTVVSGSPWLTSGNHIYNGNTGRVGIGITTPRARMAVDTSIMVDQSNSNDGTLNRGSLLFGSDGKVGIMRSYVNGSNFRSGIAFSTNSVRRLLIDSVGRVGINTTSPQQTLHVNGNTYIGGNLGIGSTTPDYALENLWGYNYMYYSLGVGTVPNSTYLLDVGATSSGARFRGDMRVDGIVNPTTTFRMGEDATVAGSLTVNNGKGVAYNGSNANNMRVTPFTTANFHAILGPHGSAETSIGLPGGFTSTPAVFVGNINVTGGTVGELNRVILVLHSCDTNSCSAKIINTDNASVDYNITWRCLAVGF